MKTTEQVKKSINTYKKLFLGDSEDFHSDYSRGFFNGLELALSLIEERPAFYVNKEKQFCKEDLENYPEYFL